MTVTLVAASVAAVNLAFVPSLFFGTDAADFYTAVGWGMGVVRQVFGRKSGGSWRPST
ncbi:hypothetical protein [Streptomyces sp. NPDC096339]|uniref:hypothetical protein n=1 Tax=Streptomyces sp. NPDC096339 TaxID=3366086 RepID=UPI003824380D